MELLYSLFSRLLDRKIDEIKATRSDSSLEDDIKDDYIAGLIGIHQQPKVVVSNQQQVLLNTKLIRVSSFLLMSTDIHNAIIQRESTSPGKLCATDSGVKKQCATQKHDRRLSHPSNCSSISRRTPPSFVIGIENGNVAAEREEGKGIRKVRTISEQTGNELTPRNDDDSLV